MENLDLPAQIVMFLFFGIFEIVGGVYIGASIRHLLAGETTELGAMVLGGMFAASALFMSAFFLKDANPWLFSVLVALFFGTVILAWLTPPSFSQRIGSGTLISIGLGLFITVLGGFIGWAGSNNGGGVGAWVFGGFWSFFGIGFLQMGVKALLTGKPLRLRPGRNGATEIVSDDKPRKSRKRAGASDDQNQSDSI